MNTSTRNGLIRFFSAPPMPCPYLSGRLERQVVTMLSGADDPDTLHTLLSQSGFRRSYNIAYKPACDGCSACVPVRVRAQTAKRTRSQTRVWRRNADLIGRRMSAVASDEHFALFERYQQARHAEGSMAEMSYDDYRDMVQETPVNTQIYEFRQPDGSLYGACLTDVLGDGLSMVYSFFDPDEENRSPGTFFILWHIEEAKRLSLPYVYLGYWIASSRKMAYKRKFQPLERLTPNGWELDAPEA